jgi:hypothetical protein
MFNRPNTKQYLACIGILLSFAFGNVQASLDTTAYDKKLLENANDSLNSNPVKANGKKALWPVKTVYPNEGALLPFHRIVAYYGNFYSKRMGALGQYSTDEVISRLGNEVKKWQAADPNTPVIPAVDYIAVVAQGKPGKDGMYRARMPADQIQKAIDLGKKLNGLTFLDIQIGLSTVQSEVPLLDSYLALPDVHLAIDPEFATKNSGLPGKKIGSLDASDINFAANHLAEIVRKNNLPPKILVIHRFTQHMITNYKEIKPLPEVQIVIDMDGWGSQTKKQGTYQDWIAGQPVQFTGFKLFYQNDLKSPSTGLYTPAELMKFTPQPLFILYQ